MLKDIEHIRVDYAMDRYAGHPRQGGIFDFGGGEIVVVYNRARCAYRTPADVGHDWGGYHVRSQTIAARSVDGGMTWNRDDDVVVSDHTPPESERMAHITQAERDPDVAREAIDLNNRDSAIVFGRAWFGDTDPPRRVTFSIRSADRGRTWECVPTPLTTPIGQKIGDGGSDVSKDGHPIVAMADGTHLAAVSHTTDVWLYGSDDHGIAWEPIARIFTDPMGGGRVAYAGMLLLPSGRLQCYGLNIAGSRDAIQMCESDDGGYGWSKPRPIVRWGRSPWVGRGAHVSVTGEGAFAKFYRSPWPLRLADGRIVVFFGRRKPPYGIGLIVSEDDGATWGDEQVVRDDASGPDIGYPAAVEVEPGRLFVAYYYMLDDGNGFGGTRFIAGTHLGI
ncbi:MAG: hypothetical protein CMJ49_07175 [Planctomycetaceae bacterium]|nr:hypothetical protein [Planctomycetaceae bacterium]